MKTLLLITGLCGAWPLASRAQAPQVPGPVSVFYTADFKLTTSSDSTALCAETTFRDSLAGMTRVYYPSGKLKQYLPYSNVAKGTVHGTLTTWYEDGTMRTKEDYVGGKRHGELLTYYPNSALKRREQYVNGSGGVGICYAPDGAQVPYFAYEQLPLYPGGQAGLINELSDGIRLNSKESDAMRRESAQAVKAMTATWKREVLVELSVGEDGRVTGAEVVKSNSRFLNAAALRSVAKLKRQFVPARLDGEVIKSRIVVPVYFTLHMPTNFASDRPSDRLLDRPIPFRNR